MANTAAQRLVERWIRENFLQGKFHQTFQERQVPLIWGGSFNFDAVSDDSKIAANISTSKARTRKKREGAGKFHKILADTFYLHNAHGLERRILIFTEQDMYDEFARRRQIGRFPQEPEIELILIDDIPHELRNGLEKSRDAASLEVTVEKPMKVEQL